MSSELEDLRARWAAGERPRLVPFWGPEGSEDGVGPHGLSQWHPTAFEVGGVRYSTAEHWMMAEKARLFGDERALVEILEAQTPARAKLLGRRVRNFDEATWCAQRRDVVLRGNLAKFTQHAALRAYLLGTGADVLVEASPRDRIWGIGLAADDPRAADPQEWIGQNLLGFVLMDVRRRLA
ncbi:MAG: NADAR family protein [Planctomycetota bacterium]